MAKEQTTMSELLQRKLHHEHKATVHRGRYIHHGKRPTLAVWTSE